MTVSDTAVGNHYSSEANYKINLKAKADTDVEFTLITSLAVPLAIIFGKLYRLGFLCLTHMELVLDKQFKTNFMQDYMKQHFFTAPQGENHLDFLLYLKVGGEENKQCPGKNPGPGC